MEKAQRQELRKICKCNLQKLLTDNSQNDHKQKSLNNKYSRGCRDLCALQLLVGCQLGTANSENRKEVGLKVKIEPPYDLVGPLRALSPEKTRIKRNRLTIVHCSTMYPSQDLEQPKFPSTDECTKKKWSTDTKEYYSDKKYKLNIKNKPKLRRHKLWRCIRAQSTRIYNQGTLLPGRYFFPRNQWGMQKSCRPVALCRNSSFKTCAKGHFICLPKDCRAINDTCQQNVLREVMAKRIQNMAQSSKKSL